jgi:hypothetical protein
MLTANEYADFEKHIQACDNCGNELEILEEIVYECSKLKELELPVDFNSSIVERLGNIEKSQSNKKHMSTTSGAPWYFNWRAFSGIAAGILIIFTVKTYFVDSKYLSQKAYIHEAETGNIQSLTAIDSASKDTALQNSDLEGTATIKENSTEYKVINKSAEYNKGKESIELRKDETIAGQSKQVQSKIDERELPDISNKKVQDTEAFSKQAPLDKEGKEFGILYESEQTQSMAKIEADNSATSWDYKMSMIAPKLTDNTDLDETKFPRIIRVINIKASTEKYNNILKLLNNQDIIFKIQNSDNVSTIILDSSLFEYIISVIDSQGIELSSIITLKDVTDEYIELNKQLEHFETNQSSENEVGIKITGEALKEKLKLMDEELQSIKVIIEITE